MGKRKDDSAKERFIKDARALGCDESPEAFDAKLRKLVTAPPTTNAKIKKGRKKK